MVPPTKIPLIIRFYDPDVQAKDARGRSLETILSWSNTELERSHDYIQILFPLPEGSPFNFSAPIIDLEVMKEFRARSELRSRLGRSFDTMMKFYGFTISYTPRPNNSEPGGEKGDDKIEPTTQKEIDAERDAQTQQATGLTEGSDREDTTAVPAIGERKGTSTNVAAPNTIEAQEEKPTITGQDVKKGGIVPGTSSKPQNTSPFIYSIVRGPNWNKASRNWCVRFDHNHLRITRILRSLRVLGLQKECMAFFAALEDVHADPELPIGDRSMMYWRRAVERPLYLAPDDEEISWLQKWEQTQQQSSESSAQG
jgi:hypothetical protein